MEAKERLGRDEKNRRAVNQDGKQGGCGGDMVGWMWEGRGGRRRWESKEGLEEDFVQR